MEDTAGKERLYEAYAVSREFHDRRTGFAGHACLLPAYHARDAAAAAVFCGRRGGPRAVCRKNRAGSGRRVRHCSDQPHCQFLRWLILRRVGRHFAARGRAGACAGEPGCPYGGLPCHHRRRADDASGHVRSASAAAGTQYARGHAAVFQRLSGLVFCGHDSVHDLQHGKRHSARAGRLKAPAAVSRGLHDCQHHPRPVLCRRSEAGGCGRGNCDEPVTAHLRVAGHPHLAARARRLPPGPQKNPPGRVAAQAHARHRASRRHFQRAL